LLFSDIKFWTEFERVKYDDIKEIFIDLFTVLFL